MNIHDTLQYLRVGVSDDIRRRKLCGDFSGAIRLIDRQLADPRVTDAMKSSLLLQKKICQALPEEFPYSKEEALSIIREAVPDFTMDELKDLMDRRCIRWIYVNGQERIFERFFSSICKAVPDFSKRTSVHVSGAEAATSGTKAADMLTQTIQAMKQNGSVTVRHRIRACLKLNDELFTPGMFLRAHLPIPKECPQQSDIRIEKLCPENAAIAPMDAAQRTVCWEVTASENHPFTVEYSYLHTARYTDAYHGTGIAGNFDFDVHEQEPHIVFTPYIQALCRELTQGISDPLMKARAFYDYITLNMTYTYMPSYSLLEDIADSCARNRNGDCGVFALLFITLCRCAGIPAQWQSGLTAEPDFIGSHDWARFYVEPYGWLFADPSYGIGAVRSGNEERRQFYFGNLDPYRMVANSAFQENFTIPKVHWRCDPYDNQSGELESSDHGFSSEEFDRSKETLLCEQV